MDRVLRQSIVEALLPFTYGDLFYADTTDTIVKLPVGSEKNVLNIGAGAPAWTPSLEIATVSASGSIKSTGATSGVGYGVGAGGTVTQDTSRTTGVLLNKACGQITLFSAAGSASWQSFTVTNSAVATADTVIVSQDSGTDKYMIHVTAVGAGSFEITYATTGGTTTEQPVFNFSVIKAVTS